MRVEFGDISRRKQARGQPAHHHQLGRFLQFLGGIDGAFNILRGDHRPRAWPCVIEGLMQENFLGRLISGQMVADPVDLCDAGRIKKAKSRIRRRD